MLYQQFAMIYMLKGKQKFHFHMTFWRVFLFFFNGKLEKNPSTNVPGDTGT